MRTPYRFALATLVGALAMFVWGGISHMLLLQGVGFSRLPRQDAVMAELRSSISRDGLYFFPSLDFERPPTAQDRSAWEAAFRQGPTGMIIFHPLGDEPISPKKLALQFLSEFLAAGIGTYLLTLMVAPYWKRVLALGLLGAFSCLSVSVLYWNWYGFPTAFLLAQCADKIVGWSLAGCLMARIAPSAHFMHRATGRTSQ
jgi:hypothetical protein